MDDGDREDGDHPAPGSGSAAKPAAGSAAGSGSATKPAAGSAAGSGSAAKPAATKPGKDEVKGGSANSGSTAPSGSGSAK
jgi:hypothetical protein